MSNHPRSLNIRAGKWKSTDLSKIQTMQIVVLVFWAPSMNREIMSFIIINGRANSDSKIKNSKVYENTKP